MQIKSKSDQHFYIWEVYFRIKEYQYTPFKVSEVA